MISSRNGGVGDWRFAFGTWRMTSWCGCTLLLPSSRAAAFKKWKRPVDRLKWSAKLPLISARLRHSFGLQTALLLTVRSLTELTVMPFCHRLFPKAFKRWSWPMHPQSCRPMAFGSVGFGALDKLDGNAAGHSPRTAPETGRATQPGSAAKPFGKRGPFNLPALLTEDSFRRAGAGMPARPPGPLRVAISFPANFGNMRCDLPCNHQMM